MWGKPMCKHNLFCKHLWCVLNFLLLEAHSSGCHGVQPWVCTVYLAHIHSTEYLYLCFGWLYSFLFAFLLFRSFHESVRGQFMGSIKGKIWTFHGISGHRYDNSFKRSVLTSILLHKWNPEATKDHKKQILIQHETIGHFRFKWILRYSIYSSNPHTYGGTCFSCTLQNLYCEGWKAFFFSSW